MEVDVIDTLHMRAIATPSDQPAAVVDLPAPSVVDALRAYADPRNWDHGGIWIGPGEGVTLAASALGKRTEWKSLNRINGSARRSNRNAIDK